MAVSLGATQTMQSHPDTGANDQEPPLITGEELFARGDIGRAELVEGKIIYMSPTGHLHGKIEAKLTTRLLVYVEPHRIGEVLSGEVGIYTGRNPDTVRAADVAFVSNERMAQVQSQSYLDVAPELIVEVMSPDDRWEHVMEKLGEYFVIGVEVVWIVQPKTQEIYAYRSLTDVERYTASDQLTCEDVLPGFDVVVADLFDGEMEGMGTNAPTGGSDSDENDSAI